MSRLISSCVHFIMIYFELATLSYIGLNRFPSLSFCLCVFHSFPTFLLKAPAFFLWFSWSGVPG